MAVLNLTVKKFYTALALFGCVLHTSTALAGSKIDSNLDNLSKGKTEISINKEQPIVKTAPAKGPELILNNKDIFNKMSRPVDGPRTGGGGNSCALAITQNTTQLVNLLDGNGYDSLLKKNELARLISKINSARFYIQDGLIKDGQVKDVMNFPNEGVIYVSSKLCATELIEVSGRSMSLLFHEYLGLSKIEDRNYQISGKFLQIYAGGKLADNQTKAYLTNELEKAMAGKKNIFGDIIEKKNQELRGKNLVFNNEAWTIEIQAIEQRNPLLYDSNRDCNTLLDGNKRKTEDDAKAVYKVCEVYSTTEYLTLVSLPVWKALSINESIITKENIIFKVVRKEYTTTVKLKDARFGEGFIKQSAETIYSVTPVDFDWEKVGTKDNN